jgi:hypothetical protein
VRRTCHRTTALFHTWWAPSIVYRQLERMRHRLGDPVDVHMWVRPPGTPGMAEDAFGVTMIGWYEHEGPEDDGERVCPDCAVERADYEHEAGGYLPRCPNCGTASAPVPTGMVLG